MNSWCECTAKEARLSRRNGRVPVCPLSQGSEFTFKGLS